MVLPFNIKGIWIFVRDDFLNYSQEDITDIMLDAGLLKQVYFQSLINLLGLFMGINKHASLQKFSS